LKDKDSHLTRKIKKKMKTELEFFNAFVCKKINFTIKKTINQKL
jgi:hypothetical protein